MILQKYFADMYKTQEWEEVRELEMVGVIYINLHLHLKHFRETRDWNFIIMKEMGFYNK